MNCGTNTNAAAQIIELDFERNKKPKHTEDAKPNERNKAKRKYTEYPCTIECLHTRKSNKVWQRYSV